ncbi:hypothetical protein OsJ_36018 [Oryza sativa Japonica Group]|uniref:Uncharacterized protein n=1 Tax=Oryza sativa subsp. japonica TaxID=39947 RepID=B9GD17_ORYSJ|nr:hypothetical protein OsJ_36018 [Oryza sativa Japonica Group]
MKQKSFMARRRGNPELVTPARATPCETKPLSDLNDHWDLRYLQPALRFFRAVDSDRRPARPGDTIRAALAEALVYYYPIAGRLRELPKGHKLAVECTGEGVVFVEAEAEATLEDFGDPPIADVLWRRGVPVRCWRCQSHRWEATVLHAAVSKHFEIQNVVKSMPIRRSNHHLCSGCGITARP